MRSILLRQPVKIEEAAGCTIKQYTAMPFKALTNADLAVMTHQQLAIVYEEEKKTFDYLGVRISELQALQKQYESNLKKIDDAKIGDFEQFFSENFVLDPGAGPLLSKEVRGIFRDWRRSLGRNTKISEPILFNYMKQKCGSGSTDKEFWGVRQRYETE